MKNKDFKSRSRSNSTEIADKIVVLRFCGKCRTEQKMTKRIFPII